MDIEEAQNKVALLKTWHILMFVYISATLSFTTSWQEFAIVFTGYQPEHYCNVSNNSSLPPHPSGRHGLYDRCNVYENDTFGINDTRPCTEGWVYVDADGPDVVPYKGSTIVTEWDLVCDNEHFKDFTQSILVVGVIMGAIGFSIASDYIGRKPVYLFSQWAMVVVGITNAYVTNYYAFTICRFCVGALQQGVMLTGFVLACELFAAKYRTFSGLMTQNFWGLACGIQPLFAYLILEWRHFQLFISIAGLVTIPMIWCMPESVHWLTANDRYEEAEQVLQTVAKINKIEMPQRILPRSENDDGTTGLRSRLRGIYKRIRNKGSKNKHSDGKKVYTILDLVTNKRLLLYTIIMSALWSINSMVYYGISLSSATLAGDRFLNASIMAFIELPGYTTAFFCVQKWGRRYPLIAYHVLAGVALLLIQFVPSSTSSGTSLVWLTILLNMVGKFGITATFGIAFLYAPEIFPTTVRNQSLGVASILGRLGHMISTYTPYITTQVPWLPGPLFGGLSIFAGLLVLLLPETHNRPLPETVEDIENWSKPKGNAMVDGVRGGHHELGSIRDDMKKVNNPI